MKSYANISNKYDRTYMVCCIFLVWQFLINIYELLWLITVNFEENVIKSHLENDKYTLSLFKKSNEVGIIFAISTVIVSFCSICIYNGAYYISKRKKNSRSFIYNEIYSIIFHTTINTMMSFTMKPILIFQYQNLTRIFVMNLYHSITKRAIFKINPYIVIVLSVSFNLYEQYTNPNFERFHFFDEYENLSDKIIRIIAKNKLDVKVFYSFENFEFCTLHNTIIMGQKDDHYERDELDNVLLHEINHVLDQATLKKKLMRTISILLFNFLKVIHLYNVNRDWIANSLFCYSLFITVYYLLNLIEHFILQKKELESDSYSAIHGNSQDMINWLLKYSLKKNIPLFHTYIFNLTYYQHPSVENRIHRLKYEEFFDKNILH